MLQKRSIPSYTASLAILAIAALLWLNFAFIEHQYDFSSAYHEEHHCELYACGLHAVSPTTPAIKVTPQNEPFITSTKYHFNEALSLAYLARSPPQLG